MDPYDKLMYRICSTLLTIILLAVAWQFVSGAMGGITIGGGG